VKVLRYVFLAVLATAIGMAARPLAARAWFAWQLAAESPPSHLPSPIGARGTFANSWGAPRDGTRRHEGIDIFAPRDTPVLSTTRGIITRIGTNRLGGQVVWVLGPGFESHYYAHLDRFGDIHLGEIVATGDVLGYVGNTGNARTTPAHLHYGIYHDGVAENPYTRLAH
jgi:murein DD-endopeptidase MepM/ murein hydrolase activator NlpD